MKRLKPTPAIDAKRFGLSIFELPWPPTFNTYWRHVGKKVLISAAGRAYRQLVAERVWSMRYAPPVQSFSIPKEPYTGRLAVTIEAYPPDALRRDLDNLLKAPLDALQKARVYLDDSQIDRLVITRGERAPNGYLRMMINDIH